MNLRFSIGWRAIYNPTNTSAGDTCGGVFRKAEAAVAAVKGKSWCGSDGHIVDVLVVEDENGQCMVIGSLPFQEFK